MRRKPLFSLQLLHRFHMNRLISSSRWFVMWPENPPSHLWLFSGSQFSSNPGSFYWHWFKVCVLFFGFLCELLSLEISDMFDCTSRNMRWFVVKVQGETGRTGRKRLPLSGNEEMSDFLLDIHDFVLWTPAEINVFCCCAALLSPILSFQHFVFTNHRTGVCSTSWSHRTTFVTFSSFCSSHLFILSEELHQPLFCRNTRELLVLVYKWLRQEPV